MGLSGKLLLVGALALVASYVKLYPEVVYAVPKVGWVFGLLIGYNLPPFFDHDAMARCYDRSNCPWLTEGDVVVDACAKCGTNWLLTVVHEIRTWDKPELRDFRDILDITPWPDFVPNPADDRMHIEEGWGTVWNNTEFPFKIYKSHLIPFKTDKKGIRSLEVPVRERRDVKFIVMVRNPVDAVHSFSLFLPKHTKEWYHVWGDLPSPGSSVPELVSGFYRSTYGAPFEFFKAWLPFAGEPNVLMMHYSEVFKDTKKYLKIIADFVGVHGIPDSEFDAILERTSVEYMKSKGHRYTYLGGYNHSVPLLSPEAMIRKGGVGASKNEISPEDKKLIEETGLELVGKELYSMLMEGFDVILNGDD